MKAQNKQYEELRSAMKEYFRQEKNNAREKFLHTLESLNKEQCRSLEKSELEKLADTLRKWVEKENAQQASCQLRGNRQGKLYGYDRWLEELNLVEHKTREEFYNTDPESWQEGYQTYTEHYYETTQKGRELYKQMFGGKDD